MSKNYKFDPKMYKTVAKNIIKYLKLEELSLDDLCNFAEIEKTYLDNFLKQENELTISIYDLYKISVILGVSIEKFFV